MNIEYDPDDYAMGTYSRPCAYHVAHPGANFAGCTCAGGQTSRLKTPEKRAATPKKPEPRETHKEYAIASTLGWWPETFDDMESLARDLAYNREHYPDVTFIVKERDATRWFDSDVEVPVVELPHYLLKGARLGVVSEPDESDEDHVNLDELSEWLDGKTL